MVTCPACGTQNPAGSEFCSRCARRLDEGTGRKVAETRSAALTTPTTGIRWAAVWTVSLVLVVIVALVLVLVLVVHV